MTTCTLSSYWIRTDRTAIYDSNYFRITVTNESPKRSSQQWNKRWMLVSVAWKKCDKIGDSRKIQSDCDNICESNAKDGEVINKQIYSHFTFYFWFYMNRSSSHLILNCKYGHWKWYTQTAHTKAPIACANVCVCFVFLVSFWFCFFYFCSWWKPWKIEKRNSQNRKKD